MGHYRLVIEEQNGSNESWSGHGVFDVEVKELPRATESVIIDVSPINPDCSGGHEFNVKSK
jgi:hypothetical protein